MKIFTSVLLAAILAGSPPMSIANPALPSGQAPAALYFDADYQPATAAAAVYEQRAPLRHDAARQAWHWQLHFAQPPGKLHMDAWLRSMDLESPRYTYQRSVYFADGQVALLEERNGEGDFDGVNVAYHADGTVKSRKAYRDGEYEGLHSHYHANGQLSHALLYHAGQPADGEYLSFDEQGQISNRAHFADGVLSGEAQAFHPNGRLAERGAVSGRSAQWPAPDLVAGRPRKVAPQFPAWQAAGLVAAVFRKWSAGPEKPVRGWRHAEHAKLARRWHAAACRGVSRRAQARPGA
ncbi:toxin-antitoxin system YwqK family antitoxin [Janthinobacterium sp. PSPC1-1]|uniref:toxin-antitoxin system YwqK family antitoxin n=1 Tax=Janthinobacterium sp. PSPC1-1 TaxID=2804581 RepID=UPI003CE6FD7C